MSGEGSEGGSDEGMKGTKWGMEAVSLISKKTLEAMHVPNSSYF